MQNMLEKSDYNIIMRDGKKSSQLWSWNVYIFANFAWEIEMILHLSKYEDIACLFGIIATLSMHMERS